MWVHGVQGVHVCGLTKCQCWRCLGLGEADASPQHSAGKRSISSACWHRRVGCSRSTNGYREGKVSLVRCGLSLHVPYSCECVCNVAPAHMQRPHCGWGGIIDYTAPN
jgi:hypothetical protein